MLDDAAVHRFAYGEDPSVDDGTAADLIDQIAERHAQRGHAAIDEIQVVVGETAHERLCKPAESQHEDGGATPLAICARSVSAARRLCGSVDHSKTIRSRSCVTCLVALRVSK